MNVIGSVRGALPALLLLFATPVAAQPYLGIGIGRTNTEYVPAANPAAGETIDDQDNAFKTLFGFGITPNLAVEVDYADLNSLVKMTSPGQTLELQAKSIGLSLLGKWQLQPNLQMFGRFGVTRWDADLTVNADSASGTGAAPMIGLGVIYRLPGNFDLRLEWTQYQNVGQNVGTATTRLTGQNVDVVWLSVAYHLKLTPGP